MYAGFCAGTCTLYTCMTKLCMYVCEQPTIDDISIVYVPQWLEIPVKTLYYARIHLRLIKVVITREPNVIRRSNLHQLTFLAESQKTLELKLMDANRE